MAARISLGPEIIVRFHQNGDEFARELGAKRKELYAISSICDEVLAQKHPARKGFGQNRLSRRRKTSPCGRMPSGILLELNDFVSNLDGNGL